MDTNRFESLVRRHKDSVYRQMIRVCRHREDAEDALATAMLLAYQAAGQLSSDAAFRSWLGTIAQRVCSKMRSHTAMERVMEIAETEKLSPDSAQAFDMQVMKGCVKDAVENLPPLYRDVYELCDIEGLTDTQAADRRTAGQRAARQGVSWRRVMSRISGRLPSLTGGPHVPIPWETMKWVCPFRWYPRLTS